MAASGGSRASTLCLNIDDSASTARCTTTCATAAHRDSQCCGLRLYVERENTGAQATYRAMGMVETHYRLYEEEFDRS